MLNTFQRFKSLDPDDFLLSVFLFNLLSIRKRRNGYSKKVSKVSTNSTQNSRTKGSFYQTQIAEVEKAASAFVKFNNKFIKDFKNCSDYDQIFYRVFFDLLPDWYNAGLTEDQVKRNAKGDAVAIYAATGYKQYQHLTNIRKLYSEISGLKAD